MRALEFDRIVSVVAGLAVTPTGMDRLAELQPLTDAGAVVAAQKATSEGTRFLADHPGFPLRAPSDLEAILDALGVNGRALESLRLLGLADYLESIEHSRAAIRNTSGTFPILGSLVERIASFKGEIADVRRKIDSSGEVADNATPALASLRDRLRASGRSFGRRSIVRARTRDVKYLQEQVVTDRKGATCWCSPSIAQHPWIVHGASASGAACTRAAHHGRDQHDIVALEERRPKKSAAPAGADRHSASAGRSAAHHTCNGVDSSGPRAIRQTWTG